MVSPPPALAVPGARGNRQPRVRALLGVCTPRRRAAHLRTRAHCALDRGAAEGTAPVLRTPAPAYRRRRARVEDLDRRVEVQPAIAVDEPQNRRTVRDRKSTR